MNDQSINRRTLPIHSSLWSKHFSDRFILLCSESLQSLSLWGSCVKPVKVWLRWQIFFSKSARNRELFSVTAASGPIVSWSDLYRDKVVCMCRVHDLKHLIFVFLKDRARGKPPVSQVYRPFSRTWDGKCIGFPRRPTCCWGIFILFLDFIWGVFLIAVFPYFSGGVRFAELGQDDCKFFLFDRNFQVYFSVFPFGWLIHLIEWLVYSLSFGWLIDWLISLAWRFFIHVWIKFFYPFPFSRFPFPRESTQDDDADWTDIHVARCFLSAECVVSLYSLHVCARRVRNKGCFCC